MELPAHYRNYDTYTVALGNQHFPSTKPRYPIRNMLITYRAYTVECQKKCLQSSYAKFSAHSF